MSSSPVATAEFSKFAGILSVALSQQHLSGSDEEPEMVPVALIPRPERFVFFFFLEG